MGPGRLLPRAWKETAKSSKKGVDRPVGYRHNGFVMPPKTADMPEAASASSPARDEIVSVAADLFYQQGYHATGIQQIINEAGIAKGTFYSHFKSKEELGVAWLQRRHTQWNGWVEKSLASKSTPRAKLLGIFEFIEQWMSDTEFRGCAFLNTASEIPSGDNPMRAEVESHKSDLREKVRGLVREHWASESGAGVSRKADIIFVLIDGAIVQAQTFRDPWPIRAARKETKELLSSSP
ncbi:MAG: TetR/AcrR family transcriptional regulator [Verrucomicrobiota bacterium]